MADALASGASVRKDVGVQVPPSAPEKVLILIRNQHFFLLSVVLPHYKFTLLRFRAAHMSQPLSAVFRSHRGHRACSIAGGRIFVLRFPPPSSRGRRTEVTVPIAPRNRAGRCCFQIHRRVNGAAEAGYPLYLPEAAHPSEYFDRKSVCARVVLQGSPLAPADSRVSILVHAGRQSSADLFDRQ